MSPFFLFVGAGFFVNLVFEDDLRISFGGAALEFANFWRWITAVCVVTLSIKSRSWEIKISSPLKLARNLAIQRTDVMSR